VSEFTNLSTKNGKTTGGGSGSSTMIEDRRKIL